MTNDLGSLTLCKWLVVLDSFGFRVSWLVAKRKNAIGWYDETMILNKEAHCGLQLNLDVVPNLNCVRSRFVRLRTLCKSKKLRRRLDPSTVSATVCVPQIALPVLVTHQAAF